MADKTQDKKEERVYVIPLREACMKVPNYKRARKAIVTIKEFIAKHMKIIDRDVDKVKLDVYLNNEIWFRGPKNAPSKVKVKAVKEGENVIVGFVDVPEHVMYAKKRHEKMHKKEDNKKDKGREEKKTEDEKEKTEDEKKAEQEKEKSAAIVKEQIAEKHAKEQKHTTKAKETQIHRMALKK